MSIKTIGKISSTYTTHGSENGQHDGHVPNGYALSGQREINHQRRGKLWQGKMRRTHGIEPYW